MATIIEAVNGGTKARDILLRDFTHKYRKGYVLVTPLSQKGETRTPPTYLLVDQFPKFEENIRNFEVRDDDILVASYPKSGTTWTQEMVWCLGNDLDFEKAESIIQLVRFPFLELCTLREPKDPSTAVTDESLRKYFKDSVNYTIEMDSPRYIKTHLPWELLPEQIISKKTKSLRAMATIIEAVNGGSKARDILLRDFINNYRKGYIFVTPISQKGDARAPPSYLFVDKYPRYEERIRNFKVREDDIFVASYPKTGTTWTQEMVWCIGNDLDFEKAKSVLQAVRFPYLELCTIRQPRFDPVMKDNESIRKFLTDSLTFTIEMDSPRYIKTHLPWELLPEQMISKKTKTVYVARNPKDTCVSYFHHARLLEGYKGNLEDFVELFLEDTLLYSPYWDHLLSYWEHRNDSNVLFIKYEDMKKDLPSVIEKVVSFMGKSPLTEEEMSKFCAHLSFDSMKKNKSVNFESFLNQELAAELPENGRHFIRKGEVGGWKEELSEDLSERFDEWTATHLSGTGLKFD